MTRHPIDLVVPDEPAAVRFMNTVWADRGGVHDALTTEADVATVLGSLGLLEADGPARATAADLDRARALRDGLRRIAAELTGDNRPHAAAEVTESGALRAVNATLRDGAPPQLERADGGWLLRPRLSSVRAALAEIARQGGELAVDPDRPLRACLAPGCVLYFVKDHPRREWCSPECGNRARAARHYAREREQRRADRA